MLGGALGAASNGVLITVKDDMLRIFKAHIDNTWSSLILAVLKNEIDNAKVKSGFFGLQKKIYFTYQNTDYTFIIPSAGKKIIEFFKYLSA